MAEGLMTFDASGNVLFDSRRYNLIYLGQATILLANLGNLVYSVYTTKKIVVYLEPTGNIGEHFTGDGLLGIGPTKTLIPVVSPHSVTVTYVAGRADIYATDMAQGFKDEFSPATIRVFHYGVDA